MEFRQFYSGSKANLYTLTAQSGNRLLIECGVTWKRLQNALAYELTGIVGCLCSHSHADHSRAAIDVLRAGIPVHTSHGTFDALGLYSERRAAVVTSQKWFGIGDFRVFPFDTIHDAVEPMGFVIKADDEYILFATDTSHIRQRFNIPFSIIAIECSYDQDILQKRVKAKDINETLAKRLLTSHQEKNVALKYLAEYCDLSKCRQIHLLHLSRENIDKVAAKKDFESKLFIETRIVQ